MTTRTVTAGHRGTATCAHCGGAFPRTRHDRRFCGARDCELSRKRQAQRKLNAKGVPATCAVCGAAFTAKTSRVKVCSKLCHDQRRAEAAAEAALGRYPPRSCLTCHNEHRKTKCPHCAAARARARRDFTEINRRRKTHRDRLDREQRTAWRRERRTCNHCGAPYTPRAPQARYCSSHCTRRANAQEGKHRRRARVKSQRTGPVSRAEILHRDGWTCQLCGDPLDRTASVPHPHAPTLDHIVPLSRGGAHGPENLQAAHFICNALKRDNETACRMQGVGDDSP